MNENKTSFADMVIKQTIRDFYTPNIKAEVILDMLLTPYIPAILQSQTGHPTTLITKELSLGHADEMTEAPSKRGKKADYVAVSDRNLYLVELKTTQSSLGTAQRRTYERLTTLEQPGIHFLQLLCSILLKKRPAHPFSALEEYLSQKLTMGKSPVCTMEAYERAKQNKALLDYTEVYQKCKRITGSDKYIHTVADIVQNSTPTDWDKPIQIVYISPNGVQAEGVVDITFRRIEESTSDTLKDFKASVLYNEIIKPLFL